MKVSLTVDVEEDIPPFFKSFEGIKKGLPKILDLFDEFRIRATFFTTAEVCEEFPDLIRKLAKKHEIACHGLYHERLDRLEPSTLREVLSDATNKIKDIIGERPVGFRAPRLRASEPLMYGLAELGYKYDSSISVWYTWQRKFIGIAEKAGIKELPISIDDTMLRLPMGMRLARTQLNRDPLVVFMHPWDAINVRREKLIKREGAGGSISIFRNSWGAGERFLRNLRILISELQEKKAKFVLARDL